MQQNRRILVTSALPYANGDIHIGHLVETIQTDIWVRFQKMRGHDCIYLCADDTHGTPIMISAKKQGITPEALIEKSYENHTADFQRYGIEFDHYSSTNSVENEVLAGEIYRAAQDAGAIEIRDISQSYCPNDGMFLPDRLVKGTCPMCKSPDQYGDSCEKCSATYSPTELIQPFCSVCGTAPVLKNASHYFFKLDHFRDAIHKWITGGHVRSEVANKLKEWFEDGLKDWDISRDAPYFGFKIPGTEDKYFYVWLDAPIGYISTTQQWAAKAGRNWIDYWKNRDTEIHHFIGKDILYFHTLFWPALLLVGGYNLPSRVHVHGFLTINGEKMSKSRGTFINAREFAEQFNPEYLRYYFASKLSSGIDDIDLNFEDFVFKVNSEVVNKVVNIASRLGSILHKSCNGILTECDTTGARMVSDIELAGDRISEMFEAVDFQRATRDVMALADLANRYIDEQAPWAVAKTDPEQAARICTAGLNALRMLAIYLKPAIPGIVGGIETFLDIPPLKWGDLKTRLFRHPIRPYQHLAQRMDMSAVKAFLEGRVAY